MKMSKIGDGGAREIKFRWPGPDEVMWYKKFGTRSGRLIFKWDSVR